MNASSEAGRQGAAARPWLLLIHQLPPKPDYLRVKVRRRLHAIGAVQLKPTVYALPDGGDSLEDFQWLRRDVEAMGGSAMICRAEFLAGITDMEIGALWETGEDEVPMATEGRAERVEPGRTWVTRIGVQVDRIASAWLIRRFIDEEARFKFVPGLGYEPEPGELLFDMYEGHYTHEGELCTFQVLQRRFGLEDQGLTLIGEIVHDIDCKDNRYHQAAMAGVEQLIRGIVAATDDDLERLARGAELFDHLHASYQPVRG